MSQSSISRDGPHPYGVERALQAVRRILDQNKNPLLAENVDHSYADKYALVENMTNTGIAAVLNVLENLEGLDETNLRNAIVVVQEQKRSMTLRLAREEDCEFVKETTKTVSSPVAHQVSVSSPTSTGDNASSVYTHKTTTEVTEYHWKAGIRHSLTLFAGTDPSTGMLMGTRLGTTRLVTPVKKHPYSPRKRSPIDLNLTWLLNQINKNTLEASFKIDRNEAKTPRRNEQTEEALRFLKELTSWTGSVLPYFQQTIWHELLGRQKDHCAEWLSKIQAVDVFVPVTPLFMDTTDQNDVDGSDGQTEKDGLVSLPPVPVDSPLLPAKDTALFLKEQSRSLRKTLTDIVGNFPDPKDTEQFVSGYEAMLVLLCLHLQDIARQWEGGIHYVEHMLYSQLVEAVGKEVKAEDFNEFQRFHNKRLLGESYAPRPFCYAIRRPNEYPDGVLSFVTETQKDGFAPFRENESLPIDTFSRCIPSDTLAETMKIPLNAATTVDFVGDQFLHGWLDTQFEGEAPAKHFISARARQFSCFLLIVGNLSGPCQFTPKDAILLQNKDEVLIPLLTSALPSAKEFKDAIKSLSPEQATFAKSFRAMQLDSSVFGVCVVQVKPQMETLLKLPPGSLVKEIQLTQDLLSLFTKYQIPSNLISYDGDDCAPVCEKVAAVKTHVKSVLDVIEGIKKEQLEEEAKKAAMREAESSFNCARFGSGEEVRGGSGNRGGLFGAPAPSPARVCVQRNSGARSLSSAAFSLSPASPAATGGGLVATPPPKQTPAPKKESLRMEDEFVSLGLEDDTNEKQQADEWAIPLTDFTAIPKTLDRMFESFDKDAALRTMTIKTGDRWTRKHQENLLTDMITDVMSFDTKKTETNKALDLLDALSRSGSLPVASGELHVVIGVRHSFERNVMATVIADNVNPVDKVDWSSLLIGSTVHQVDVPTLLNGSVDPPTRVLNDRKFPPLMIGQSSA